MANATVNRKKTAKIEIGNLLSNPTNAGEGGN
jgi:hypothetical protein